MSNIATVLKSEMARVARKAGRAGTDGLRKTVSVQRADIAALKRQVSDLEKALKALTKAIGRAPDAAGALAALPEDTSGLRFRVQGMAKNRQRLGLSAEDFGLLVGATGQSVYLWESGKTKPRAKALAAIPALRGMGKREAPAPPAAA